MPKRRTDMREQRHNQTKPSIPVFAPENAVQTPPAPTQSQSARHGLDVHRGCRSWAIRNYQAPFSGCQNGSIKYKIPVF